MVRGGAFRGGKTARGQKGKQPYRANGRKFPSIKKVKPYPFPKKADTENDHVEQRVPAGGGHRGECFGRET